MVLTTLVPLIYTAIKSSELIRRFFSVVMLVLKGINPLGGKSPLFAILYGVLVFLGGLSLILYFYFALGFQLYLKFFDVIFTPFSWVIETLFKMFIDQLPNLPANTSSVLCLFDFGSAFTLFFLGFSFEVYLRILVYFIVRRGR